jgi:hypothetical protein
MQVANNFHAYFYSMHPVVYLFRLVVYRGQSTQQLYNINKTK